MTGKRRDLGEFIHPVPAVPAALPEHPATPDSASTAARKKAAISAVKYAGFSAGQKGGKDDGDDAGLPTSTARSPRRAGRPRGPRRTALSVRILHTTDERLTAAVEGTGRNPQSIVDEALARYLTRIGY